MMERTDPIAADTARGRLPPALAASTVGGVTAVVVSYNSARRLSALGEALSASTLRLDRMLVVDNASVDDTVARAREAGFEVHETGSNDGFGAGCNVALRLADTEFVLICNPDVVPAPAALEQLMAALWAVPTAAIAGAAFDQKVQARRFSRLSATVWSFLPRRAQRPLKRFAVEVSVDRSREYVAVDYVVGAFMLCRVDALRSVGGFDERFFLYSEEEDLCRRLGEHGWQTLFVPSVSLTHEHSTSSEGVNIAVMSPFRFHSLYWYYRKYHSRAYAELARFTLAACLIADRTYRVLTRRQQVYGPGAATAPFRAIGSLRRAQERRTARRMR
jgi:N-acetylglucosaminyl-diphospho-decaprenol L-rhamnosyltransferase